MQGPGVGHQCALLLESTLIRIVYTEKMLVSSSISII